MSIVRDFTALLKTLSADRKMLKLFFVIICMLIVIGYFVIPLLIKTKKVDNPTQCDYLIEQNRQLVNSLLDIRKGLSEMSATQPTSYIESHSDFMFASMIDTTPKPLTKGQMQQRIDQMMRKVDSVLIKNRLDSLRRVDSFKRQKS